MPAITRNHLPSLVNMRIHWCCRISYPSNALSDLLILLILLAGTLKFYLAVALDLEKRVLCV
jgi:hypothetical protein